MLMDIRMSGIDGLEPTRRIMAASHPPRVLILTTFDGDEYIIAALVAEASGFLLKRRRVRTTPGRNPHYHPGRLAFVPLGDPPADRVVHPRLPAHAADPNVRIRRSHDTNDNAECRIAATVIDIQSDA